MTRILVPTALSLAMLAIASSPGGIRTASAQELSRLERVRAELPADAARSIERTLAEARRLGIPTDPLIDKALEGAAKQVQPARIVEVVQGLAQRLHHAQQLLDASASPSDITAVADALQRGVPDEAVRALGTEVPRGASVAASVHTLADLLDRGVPVGVALDAVKEWRGRARDAAELRELPAAVERLIRDGVLPEQAAAAVASAVRGGGRPATAGPPPGVGAGKAPGPQTGVPVAPGKGNGKGNGKGKGQGKGQGGKPTSGPPS
jgi:hypothetical protein